MRIEFIDFYTCLEVKVVFNPWLKILELVVDLLFGGANFLYPFDLQN
jgi:hypothetical protein